MRTPHNVIVNMLYTPRNVQHEWHLNCYTKKRLYRIGLCQN